MKMSVKQLRAFLAVAHTLNFAQASLRLNLSQPALSLAVRSLEEGLGGPLLTRTTRRVILTPEGEAFFPMARQLLADWDNAEEAMRQRFTLQRGKVSLAAMPSFAGNSLPPILRTFRNSHAGINVTVHDVVNEQVLEMVRDGRVEMGIAFEPELDASLHFTPLINDRFVAVVPASSALATLSRVSWMTLLSLDFITLQRPSAVRVLLEETLAKRRLKLDVAFESHQLVTVGRMVASGLGVSAVPALCADQMRELGAVTLPLHAPIIERQVGIIRPAPLQLSAAAQALAATISRGFEAPERDRVSLSVQPQV